MINNIYNIFIDNHLTRDLYIHLWLNTQIEYKQEPILVQNKTVVIKEGETIFSYRKYSEILRTSISDCIKSFQELISKGFINSCTRNNLTIVTLNNTDKYFKLNTVVYNNIDIIEIDTIKTKIEDELFDKKDKDNWIENKFKAFWDKYPRKLGKKRAFDLFKKEIKNEGDFKVLGMALIKYLALINRDKLTDKYILHGSTFMNNYKDFYELTETNIKTQEEKSYEEFMNYGK